MKLGLVGWRGMVGSIVCQRLTEMQLWDQCHGHFFSTSQTGQDAPDYPNRFESLLDAFDLNALESMNVIISCQGSSYTKRVYQELRHKRGWKGYWIDAASELRLAPEATLCLEPVNSELLRRRLTEGKTTFCGPNCTVSLLLLALQGLLQEDLIEWISTMTYQAISGAGAAPVKELLLQQKILSDAYDRKTLEELSANELMRLVDSAWRKGDFPSETIGAPMSSNLMPWIDSAVASGATREEWKAAVEAQKILDIKEGSFAVDGICTRVPVLRCHSQGITLKLKQKLSIDKIEQLLRQSHEDIEVVANSALDTKARLNPLAISGTRKIAIGRIRTSLLGPEFIHAFTIGDQLLWGAAEPLVRMLGLILSKENKGDVA